MRFPRWLKRLVGAGLSAVMAGLAPGLSFYQALADDVVTPVTVNGGAGQVGRGYVTPGVPGAPQTGGTNGSASGLLKGGGSAEFRRHAGGASDATSLSDDEGQVEDAVSPSPSPLPKGERVSSSRRSAEDATYGTPLPAGEVAAKAAGEGSSPSAVRSNLDRERTRIAREHKVQGPLSPESAVSGGAREFERAVYGHAVSNGIAPQRPVQPGAASPRGPPQTVWPKPQGPGSIDLSRGGFEPHERVIADFLKDEGHRVVALPEDGSDHHRHPDASIDGVEVEFKTRLAGRPDEERRKKRSTEKWVVQTVEHSLGIHRGPGESHEQQARVMFLDARGTRLEAQHVYKAAAQLAPYFGPRLDSLRVVGDGYDLAFGRWPAPRPDLRAGNAVAPSGPPQDKPAAKTASGLSPPGSGALAPLPPYRAPLRSVLWLNAMRAVHYGAFAASLGALVTALGAPGALVPLGLIGAFVFAFQRGEARLPIYDRNAAVAKDAATARLEGDPGAEGWWRTYRLLGGLLVRMGRDPARDMPALLPAFGPSEADTARSEGNGIQHASDIYVGKNLLGSRASLVAPVLGHELAHLRYNDARVTRHLRDGRAPWLLGLLFRFSVLWGAPLTGAAYGAAYIGKTILAASAAGQAAALAAVGPTWLMAIAIAAPFIFAWRLTRQQISSVDEARAPPAKDRGALVAWGASVLAGKLALAALAAPAFWSFGSSSPELFAGSLAAALLFAAAGRVAGHAITRAKELRADAVGAYYTHPSLLADFLERFVPDAQPKWQLPGWTVKLDHVLTSDYPTTAQRVASLRRMAEKSGPVPDLESLATLWDDVSVSGIPAQGEASSTPRPGNGVTDVTLLYARERSGHAQAAKALAAQIAKDEPSAKVSDVRFDTTVSPRISRTGTRVYGWILKNAPFIWEWVYDNKVLDAVTRVPVQLFLAFTGRRVAKAVKAAKPQAAIATQALLAASLAASATKEGLEVPLFGVLTDFTLNSFWIRPQVQHYFVADEIVKQEMIRRGVPADRITVSGIPIHPKFQAGMSRQDARRKLGLDPDRPVVLLTGGSHGLGGFGDVLKEVLSLQVNAQIVVITGGNKTLKAELETAYGKNPALRIEGYVTNMDEWMRAADLMIGKPGGLTTAEAMAVGLPMIILDPLPGQESRNTRFLTERGAALKYDDYRALSAELGKLLNDQAKLETLQQNASRLAKPDAARVILEKVRALVK